MKDQKSFKRPELTNEPVSFEEKTSWELQWRKERTRNWVVIIAIISVVLLMMTAIIASSMSANPAAVAKEAFLAIAGFTQSIVAIIIMAFFDVKKGSVNSSETNIEN